MKKLLGILVLGLLISSCDSAEEKAFNNCVEDLKGREYEGKKINELVASFQCEKFKKEMQGIFYKRLYQCTYVSENLVFTI